MEWHDEAIVIAARPHGESSLLVSLFSQVHGRHAGLARGGAGPRRRGDFQPGNQLAAHWRARLADHLGSFTCELTGARAARCLADADALAALASACALCEVGLPERLPMPSLYQRLAGLLDRIAAGTPDWRAAYVAWEVDYLAELGFGLDLSECAVTGETDGLVFVSPRTGRAVSGAGAGRFADRLLPLPAFLHTPGAAADAEAIADGLRLTGHFLDAHIFQPPERRMPEARARLVDRLSRRPAPRRAS
ncbi:MAG: DNA repair protein RecO [Alphaproteobacteria bacterium]